MPLNVLKERFLDRLQGAVPQNECRYKHNKPWLHEFAEASNWFLKTQIDPRGRLSCSTQMGKT